MTKTTKMRRRSRKLFQFIKPRRTKDRPLTTDEKVRAMDRLIANIKQKAREAGFDLENDEPDDMEE